MGSWALGSFVLVFGFPFVGSKATQKHKGQNKRAVSLVLTVGQH
jgi:hypothetical protein